MNDYISITNKLAHVSCMCKMINTLRKGIKFSVQRVYHSVNKLKLTPQEFKNNAYKE